MSLRMDFDGFNTRMGNTFLLLVLLYIEFCNLNAAQGYKAYKMIKERRIKRRTIKNELNVLNIILGKKISETATDEIEKAVAGMDKRIYEPRIIEELFDF